MINTFIKNKISKNKGYTLLFAVIVSSIVLSVGLSILTISKKEFLLATSARDSTSALYAADSGIECAMYWDSVGRIDLSTGGSIYCGDSSEVIPVTYNGGVASFSITLFGGANAIVTVKKEIDNNSYGIPIEKTQIDSLGYNTESGPRKVERALRLNY